MESENIIGELDLPENTNSDRSVRWRSWENEDDHQQHCEVSPRRSDAFWRNARVMRCTITLLVRVNRRWSTSRKVTKSKCTFWRNPPTRTLWLLARRPMKIMQSHQSWSLWELHWFEEVDEMILERRWRHIMLRTDGGRTNSSDRRKNRWNLSQHSTEANPRTSRCTDRQQAKTHTQSGGEDRQRFSISRSKLRKHQMPRLSQGTTQQRTKWTSRKLSGSEAIWDHQEHRAENESDRPAEGSIMWAKENSIQSQHIWQESGCAEYDTKPRSSRQCRIQSMDPTTIRQAKITQFDKHVEILEEQYIDIPKESSNSPNRSLGTMEMHRV